MARPPAKVVRSQRFASRRRDVRRARQRRRRRATIAVATLMLVGAGGWTLARSSLFALERIEVAGNTTLARAEVLRASGLERGANLLSLDLEVVEMRVARLALVRTVEVTKPAPSRVRIVVTERTPAFTLETIHGLYHLDAEAVVLSATHAPNGRLPIVRALSHPPSEVGDRIRSADVSSALALWAALPKHLRAGAPTIEVTAAGLTMTRPDLTIRFGPFERIGQKVEAVRLVIERVRAAKARLTSIDVRSPERPAAA